MIINNRIKITINNLGDNNVQRTREYINRELQEVKILVVNYNCEAVVKYGLRKVTINKFTNITAIVETWFK